ncbi:endosomal/lysosomal potassium channel TMEM175 isoform X2 [Myotis myotis]|uniref:endosomal/lysosomal potassium channel TMEM175 isoform X2 n=1 Tax=Myotis myotis TaxID=51298 RepID=UPI00174BC749|nr:endosomal/lysosomal potassium channel TMEM175 isoform X2 [Myotis myotis]
MSGSRAPEPALSVQGDATTSTGDEDEDAAHGTQHSHRMLSFSDALLSIIATVMILPVTHTEISPEQFDRSIQKLLATRIAVYLMTFLIVTVAWAAHTRLFQVVGKIDDTLALLNLACMMTITFLPYTFSLMMAFPEVPLGIFLFCVCVIAIGAVQIGCSAHRGLYRRHILHIVLRGPALCFLAAGFSLFFYPVSYLLMATVIFLPYASKAASWCRGRLVGAAQQRAGGGLQRRGLRHRGHAPHPGHLRGQRPRRQGRGGEVPGQPGGRAERVRAAVPGLLRLLRHRGPALVRPPLPLPARAQGHAIHGAAQHALAGLRGWPAPGLPADLGLRPAATRRARERARQLRHHLLRQHLPVRHVDRGPAARGGDAAALGVVRGPGARLHVRQAGALPLCQPAGLHPHLRAEQVQHGHLPQHADRRALRLPAAAAPRAPGAGPPAGPAGPGRARPGHHGPKGPTAPCPLLAPPLPGLGFVGARAHLCPGPTQARAAVWGWQVGVLWPWVLSARQALLGPHGPTWPTLPTCRPPSPQWCRRRDKRDAAGRAQTVLPTYVRAAGRMWHRRHWCEATDTSGHRRT